MNTRADNLFLHRINYSISPPIKFSAISGIFAEKSPQMKIILSHFIILAIQYTYGTLIWGIVHVCSSLILRDSL